MEGCEKIHFLTEAIYKNLIDNFNPGIKQLISTGRIYQKSVLNMTSAAKSYIDCMYGLAQNGQVCKGATSDIGTALLQLAEVCRHINTQVVDSIKLFHSELLMPLETKQETEYRQIQAVYKKYMAGHKYNVVPYEKAQTTLKKHKKKTKAKYGFDQKEMQYTRQVREYRVNLNEYHLQGLRQALLEERQCYCFLLDRTCVIMHNYAERLSKMHQLVTKQISEWRSLSEDASSLPESSEAVIQAFRHQDGMYCGVDDIQDLRHSRASECDLNHQTCGQTNSDMSTGRHMMGGGESGSMTCSSTPSTCSDPNQQPDTQLKSVVMPRCQQQAPSHVQAMYSYTSADDIQLNFMDGDIIAVLGERKDGWQYGENIHTKSAGWFPISFTQPLSDRRADRHQNSALRHRVKSLGNLYDLGNPNYQFALDTMTGQLQRSHTIAERPMSMYVDGNQLYNMQTSPYGVTKMFIPKTILEAEEKFIASPVSEMDNHYPNNLPPLQRVVPPGGGSRDRVEPATSGSVPDVSNINHLDIIPPPPLDGLCFPSPPPPSPLPPSTPPPPATPSSTHHPQPVTSPCGGCPATIQQGSRPPQSSCEWGYTDQRGGNYTTHSHVVYTPTPVTYTPTPVSYTPTPVTYTPASVTYMPTPSPGASSSGYSSGASRRSYPLYSSGTLPRLPPPPLPPPNLAPPLPPPNLAPPQPNFNYNNDLQSGQILTSVW